MLWSQLVVRNRASIIIVNVGEENRLYSTQDVSDTNSSTIIDPTVDSAVGDVMIGSKLGQIGPK